LLRGFQSTKNRSEIFVVKRKNIDAANRREAKKRRKAIKRKAQASTATLRNIQTEYPTEYVSANKISEVILEYAEPLTNDLQSATVGTQAARSTWIFAESNRNRKKDRSAVTMS
jgi:peptide methionine sulfoxide reductase MsrA